jgi:DMSO/TMAO reductase YedYZ molybdopterin-dependent catalytic subunit
VACDTHRVGIISRGFKGRGRGDDSGRLPPGQYVTPDFPVLSAGPTPRLDTDKWEFGIITESGKRHIWSWSDLRALPSENVTVDLHCVTKWSKFKTGWRGVAIDTLFEEVESAADYVMVHAYGGYTTNLPLGDLLDGQAWIAYEYEGEPLHPEHGGPARLLVPHLYLWKSAKWVRAFEMTIEDQPGFWETAGYHNYGDPWREQRYWGD